MKNDDIVLFLIIVFCIGVMLGYLICLNNINAECEIDMDVFERDLNLLTNFSAKIHDKELFDISRYVKGDMTLYQIQDIYYQFRPTSSIVFHAYMQRLCK